MQVFVQTLTNNVASFQVEPTQTIADLKKTISDAEGIPTVLQKLVYGGEMLVDERTIEECTIPAEATLYLSVGLLGGKKGKKKNYTTPYKPKHKHKSNKLGFLSLFSCDGNKVTRQRKGCPEPACGPGIYMARHFDRHYCGKCGLTLKVDPSQILKKVSKAGKDSKAAPTGKEGKGKKGGKDDKKGKKGKQTEWSLRK
eukprot:TRINITY_DN24_c0_g1_i1.p2 TRINITY_DN24_c0_g1~~TRINITY_DN24_c0_g1_i1.p2  ORF type:complete len:198 (+),score=78.44 TRINITY_DN24_c0_g1_i1:42-635(+)